MRPDQSFDPETAFDDEFDVEIPETVDRAAIKRMKTVAKLLDEAVRIPGIGVRVGIDPVLGLAPISGDLASAALSMYIVVESARLGVSFTTLVRMIANVSIDVLGSAIPYVGTLFDVFWKANKKNVELALDDLLAESDRQTAEVIEVEVQ
jgi:hypothetical protein